MSMQLVAAIQFVAAAALIVGAYILWRRSR